MKEQKGATAARLTEWDGYCSHGDLKGPDARRVMEAAGQRVNFPPARPSPRPPPRRRPPQPVTRPSATTLSGLAELSAQGWSRAEQQFFVRPPREQRIVEVGDRASMYMRNAWQAIRIYEDDTSSS